MSKEDIEALQPLRFSWKDGERRASLGAVYAALLAKIDDSLTWYGAARANKRKMGSFIRYTGILLGMLAAAFPTMTEIALKTNPNLSWWQRPGLATILGIVVGGLFLLDRFAGGTSGWVRYTMAETSLKELRDELAFAFAMEQGQWAGSGEPSVEQTNHALVTLQGFLSRVNLIIRNETDQWKTEFQSALVQTDEYIKAQPKKVEEATGTVKLTNPDRLAGKWYVSFNEGPEQEAADDSKSFRLTPGSLMLRVRAVIKANADGSQKRECRLELGDTLTAGAPRVIPVTLPPS